MPGTRNLAGQSFRRGNLYITNWNQLRVELRPARAVATSTMVILCSI